MEFLQAYTASLFGLGATPSVSASYRQELEHAYRAPGRYYHTLQHLNHMWRELEQAPGLFHHSDILIMSVAYHDFVYDPASKTNEEESATIARVRLESIEVADSRISLCEKYIRATKTHQAMDEMEGNYLIDADLSILGADPKEYHQYASAIRNEYAVYPDPVYREGRTQVLQHFLQSSRIYKTSRFYELYEEKARINLAKELEQLL